MEARQTTLLISFVEVVGILILLTLLFIPIWRKTVSTGAVTPNTVLAPVVGETIEDAKSALSAGSRH